MALAPQALYNSRLENMRKNSGEGPTDLINYEGIFDRVARRIDEIDPTGREAYALLQELNGISCRSLYLSQQIVVEGKN